MTHRRFTRRDFFTAAATAAAAGALAPRAAAQPRVLGTVLDYSAGVPTGRSVRAAGHLGAVRYVSQPRPGASWMRGKPVLSNETEDFRVNGLATASVYQYGKGDTADWLAGAAGATTHAPQAIALHRAAGGPTGRPIYVAIDDNPTRAQYDSQIRPYLRAFSAALGAAGYQTGVYGNYNVIQWCVEDGIGTYFWMHDWGSGGRIHPRAQLHQPSGRRTFIDGVECDVNNVFATDWGQWTPGGASLPPAPGPLQQAVQASSQASSQLPVDQVVSAARAILGK
ncbi:DUF1906 domain-containing protein [Corynebacterium auris]|uniref:DUF1906 domain-containing protein n=1 Tax=Corynebacterium auris TaxID=44750 RepID=UPI0025B3A58F|nr:DUF1906 domain-containing protein [Corynebacterium auris]WJY67587.1 hypothetical protein CAURIS_03335 [Corynebacterium auris]